MCTFAKSQCVSEDGKRRRREGGKEQEEEEDRDVVVGKSKTNPKQHVVIYTNVTYVGVYSNLKQPLHRFPSWHPTRESY